MNMYIDIGNTRVKWKLMPCQENIVTEHFPYNLLSLDQLLTTHFSGLNKTQITNVFISNVAGDEIKSKISRWFVDNLHIEPRFAISSEKVHHIKNKYKQPASLGVDRLLAMLAVSHLERKPYVIVDCGTATTIDCITESGVFVGGLILPGMRLMQSMLERKTNEITLVDVNDTVTPFALDTSTGVFSGAIIATHATIENSMRELTKRTGITAGCVLTGGDGVVLTSYLHTAATYYEDLVLEGLMYYFQA